MGRPIGGGGREIRWSVGGSAVGRGVGFWVVGGSEIALAAHASSFFLGGKDFLQRLEMDGVSK
jgi:hypothetical protein